VVKKAQKAKKAKDLSTFAIADMLHADPGSVANWIDQDLLKAHRTPGGHRRVAAEDLLRFLREHKMPIPAELGRPPSRVLVVDEAPAVTQLVARSLKAIHSDCEVYEAHDAFHAGIMVATLKPSVVVLDLHVPAMDGYEACRLIKSQETTRGAEVIAMTAYPSAESEQRILECGAKICLSKPLDMAQLIEQVEVSL